MVYIDGMMNFVAHIDCSFLVKYWAYPDSHPPVYGELGVSGDAVNGVIYDQPTIEILDRITLMQMSDQERFTTVQS